MVAPINPATSSGHLKKGTHRYVRIFPVPVRAWEFGVAKRVLGAVSSRVSPLNLVRLLTGLHSISPGSRDRIHKYHQFPMGSVPGGHRWWFTAESPPGQG